MFLDLQSYFTKSIELPILDQQTPKIMKEDDVLTYLLQKFLHFFEQVDLTRTRGV